MTTTSATPMQTSDSAAWASIAFLGLGVIFAQLATPMPIAARSLQTLAIASAALGGAAYFYRNVRIRENFAVMCIALMQVLLFSALGSILSYLLARGGGSLWDSTFTNWDRALGLDWLGFVRAVDQHGWLVTTLRLAYASLIPQIIVLVLVLGFTGRLEKLRSVMLGAILCGTICVLASPFFPAVSNYVHLGLTAADFRHVDPWAGYIHLADFNGLREGTMNQLDLSKMQGIITFPSYHAGLSAVTLWGFWTSGVRWQMDRTDRRAWNDRRHTGRWRPLFRRCAGGDRDRHRQHPRRFASGALGARLAAPHGIAIPPFTCSVWPVTYPASVDAR